MNEIHQRLQDVLKASEADALEMLRRMVAVNSFTNNPAGVDALGKMTAEAFAGLGFTAEQVPSGRDDCGPHLVLTREGTGQDVVGLVSHLDTVYPPEVEERHDFRYREDGDRIYGPGTVDIKGGTVLVHMMLDALRQVVPEVFSATTWVVLLNAAEEQLETSFETLCRQRLDAERTRAVLVVEGGLLRDGKALVVRARKGMAVFRVTVEGRAAHAGNAHPRGANAILQLADAVREIEGWTDPSKKITFSVGTIRGGSVTNQVPPEAVAEVEMRAFDADVFAEGMARMKGLEDVCTVRAVEDGFPCKTRVEVLVDQSPWPRNEGSDRLLEVWQAAARDVGLEVVPEERGGLSDGNQIWDHAPILDGLGPSGAHAHCPEQSEDGSKEQEYATRSSFVPKALLNLAALLRLLGE